MPRAGNAIKAAGAKSTGTFQFSRFGGDCVEASNYTEVMGGMRRRQENA
jgi:predicted transcriptional regulator